MTDVTPPELLSAYNSALIERYQDALSDYVSVPLVSSDETRSEPLKAVLQDSKAPILVLGDSGIGKTMLLINLIRESAVDPPALLLKMKFLNGDRTILDVAALSVAEEIGSVNRILGREVRPDELRTVLGDALKGDHRLAILCDGMNEIAGDRSIIVKEKFYEFLLNHYQHAYVLTCRTDDLATAKAVAGFRPSTWKLRLFELDEVSAFVKGFVALTPDERSSLDEALKSNGKILEMARNPNNLSLIVRFFMAEKKLPSNLYSLYSWMVARLLERQESQPSFEGEAEISASAKFQLIAGVAAKMTAAGTLHVASQSTSGGQDMVDMILGVLESDSQTRLKVPEGLAHNPGRLAALIIAKTLFSGDEKVGYSFVHQSFQEFLSAAWLGRFYSRLTQFDFHKIVADPNWEEVFTFLSSSLELDEFKRLVDQISAAGDLGVLLAGKCALQFKADARFPEYCDEVREDLFKMATESKSYENRYRAIEMAYDLGFGRYAKDLLFHSLMSRNWLVREGATRILGDLKLEEAELPVARLASDDVMWVRASAVWTLGEIGLSSSEGLVTEALKDDCDFVSRWAESALRRLRRERGGESDSEEWLQTFWKQKALGDLGAEEIEDYFIKGLQSDDWWKREVSLEAVAQLGSLRARPVVLKLETDPKEWVRAWVMRALGDLRYPESEEVLIRGLRDMNEWVKVWAAISLQKLRSKKAEDGLLELVGSSNKYERLAAVSALGECGSTKAVKSLERLGRDPDEEVSQEAVLSLSSLAGGQRGPLDVFQVMRRPAGEEFARGLHLLKGIMERMKVGIEENVAVRQKAMATTPPTGSKTLGEQLEAWEARLRKLEAIELEVEEFRARPAERSQERWSAILDAVDRLGSDVDGARWAPMRLALGKYDEA